MQIYKYPLDFGVTGKRVTVNMPVGAQVLTMQLQDGGPVLWALVNPHSPLEPRTFAEYQTGSDIPYNPGKYIGTYQYSWYVGHVFETTEVSK